MRRLPHTVSAAFTPALISMAMCALCVCNARIVKDEYIIFIHEVVNNFKCTHSARAYFTGKNGCKFLFRFVLLFILFSRVVVVATVVLLFGLISF